MKKLILLSIILISFVSCLRKENNTTCVCRDWDKDGEQLEVTLNTTKEVCFYRHTHYMSRYKNVNCDLQ